MNYYVNCCLRAVGLVLLLLLSVPASATPVTYGFTSGTITVTARQSTDNATVFSQVVALSGASFVTWDALGTPGAGQGALDDFLLQMVPNQGPFATVIPYGFYDSVSLDSAAIRPDFAAGFGTNFSFGGQIQVQQVAIDAFYTASNCNAGALCASAGGQIPDPSPSTAAVITGITPMGAALSFPDPAQIQLAVFGLLMGTVDGTPFGEAGNNLEIRADIAFFGNSSIVPVPEPSTGLLLALGMVGLAVVRREGSTTSLDRRQG